MKVITDTVFDVMRALAALLEQEGQADKVVQFVTDHPECLQTMAAFIVHAVDFEIKRVEDVFDVAGYHATTKKLNVFDGSKIADSEIEECVAAIDDSGRQIEGYRERRETGSRESI